MKFMLIGSGKMGSALLSAFYSTDVFERYVIVGKNESLLSTNFGEDFYSSIDLVPDDFEPDVVLFAVKPQDMATALLGYDRYKDKALFISIAAGLRISFFEKHLGSECSIVRVMPNLCVRSGYGMTVGVANKNVDADGKNLVSKMFQRTGKYSWLDKEEDIDLVTAISGSGPAYYFLLTECLVNELINYGLDSSMALRIVKQTFAGSAELVNFSSKNIDELRASVTSRNGVTEEAVKVLLPRLPKLISEAISKAKKRSEDLSQ